MFVFSIKQFIRQIQKWLRAGVLEEDGTITECASGVNGTPSSLKSSLCTLHLIVTNFGATLNMSGWLELAQQRLCSACPLSHYKPF